MFRAAAILLLTMHISCSLSAQKKVPAGNSNTTSYGDWVVMAQKEADGFVRDKNNVYMYLNHYSGKKEMYRINNNKPELFLGDDILHNKERSSLNPIFDSKSNLYFLYWQHDTYDIIRKWDGTKLIPFGESGERLDFNSIHADPLGNIIGSVWVGPGDPEYFLIFKEGKWVSMGIEKRKEFSKEHSSWNRLWYQADTAGNFYVNTVEHITKWDGLQWTDIPTKGLGGRISQMFFSTTNVLYVVVNGSVGALTGKNTGTIKKFENGEWIEMKWGLEFFQQPDIINISYHLAGVDNVYALVDIGENLSHEKQKIVYSRRNGQWENIITGNPDVSPDDYYKLKTVNNDLYLMNDTKDFFAKWDPGKPVRRKPVAKSIAPAILVSQRKRVSAILPGSQCVITARKRSDPKYKVGDTIKLTGPAYSFDDMWYSTAMGINAKNEILSLADFKAKIIYQPAFTSNTKCDSLAETPNDNFGFGKGVKVKILAVGDLDKDQYARASSYVGKVFTVFSAVHPIGDCWYWGIFEKEGKIFIINCVQIQKVSSDN